MKLKSIIVDDEPVARKLLQEYIEDIDFIELAGVAENPLKANSILQNQPVDVMFLDISMPKLTGIEFLKTSALLPMAIMTTAYADYAIEAFNLDVMDYLVKPFSFERFLKACNKAKDYFELKNKPPAELGTVNEYFFVKCDGRIEKVFYNELVYVEAMLNYVVLHTETRKMIVYLTIKSIAEQLPQHIFLKVHKSSIININRVKSIEGNEINLGNARVTISQNFYDAVIKQILKDRMIKR
jgi:DNA-binding LytR/AlgR family response regulator